jgi:glycopeptide antibiotics resistance protein
MIAKLLCDKRLFLTYLSLIILLIVLPLNSAELNNITILQLRGDYFFHILLFLPWMFFKKAFNIRLLVWLLLGLVFASATEGLQYLLPWRAFNVNDLAANGLGILVGFLVYFFYMKGEMSDER